MKISVVTRGMDMPDVKVEAVCVMGRGIEQVATSRGLVWRPTRYIELPCADGHHSGFRSTIGPDDEFALIAGGNANVLALLHMLKGWARSGLPTPRIVLAAGRPAYLDSAPAGLSEGAIYLQELRRRAGAEFNAIILERNRTTRDDVREFLSVSSSAGLRTLGVLTVDVHLDRTAKYFRMYEHLTPLAEVHLFSSEAILCRRYQRRRGVVAVSGRLPRSRAFVKTRTREQSGIRAIDEGQYKY